MEAGSNFTDIRKYVDLRLEETKLRAAKGISAIMSQIAAYLIIAVLTIITVCFLVIVEMQCLNEWLGQPFGTLIATGTLILVIVILFLLRKHLFAGILGKGIAGVLGLETKDVDKDLSAVRSDIKILEHRFDVNKSSFFKRTLAKAAFAISILKKLCK